jgi:hypothetical protein
MCFWQEDHAEQQPDTDSCRAQQAEVKQMHAAYMHLQEAQQRWQHPLSMHGVLLV